jgi:outer membrane protein assembly factor BamE (lipoprotein component of BamABCDE complex)
MTSGDNQFNRADSASGTVPASPRGPGRLRLMAGTLLLGLALTACQARIDSRGYVPDPDELERVKAGLQGREEVQQILGSPSAVSTFADDRWYYISKKTRSIAFFTPTVLDQNVVVVEFDDGGFVKDVRRYAMEDGLIIDPVTRKTPAPGRELSFLEQLLGNFGKFNSTSNMTPGGSN